MVAITFKVSPEEARKIRAAARSAHRTVSAHIRSALLPPAPARRPRLALRKHPVSGLPYNATGNNLPNVSLADIKTALADFP